MMHSLTKTEGGDTDSNTAIVVDFDTSLSIMYTTGQKVIKEAKDLNHTMLSVGLNKFRQSIPPDNSRLHILFKCM